MKRGVSLTTQKRFVSNRIITFSMIAGIIVVFGEFIGTHEPKAWQIAAEYILVVPLVYFGRYMRLITFNKRTRLRKVLLIAIGFIFVDFITSQIGILPGLSVNLYENSVFYATSIAVLGTSFLILQKTSKSFLFVLLVSLMLLIIESRSIVSAYFTINMLYVFLNAKNKIISGLVILIVIPIILYGVPRGLNYLVRPRRNLIINSSDFSNPVWNKSLAKRFSIQKSDILDPAGKHNAFLLEAESDVNGPYPDVLVFQKIGISERDESYVASVYLKAKELRQTVKISTNLGKATLCNVTPDSWTRCITKPIEGNGQSHLQFKLKSALAGGGVSCYIWGAQLEAGYLASKPEITHFTWLMRSFNSLDPKLRNLILGRKWLRFSTRSDIWKKSIGIFLSAPVFGVGQRELVAKLNEGALKERGLVGHAHNLVLQILASFGLVGLLAWCISFAIVLISFSRFDKIWPMILLVVFINMFDYVYFTNLAYYSFWLTIGYFSPFERNSMAI